jgi:hypothetical protein
LTPAAEQLIWNRGFYAWMMSKALDMRTINESPRKYQPRFAYAAVNAGFLRHEAINPQEFSRRRLTEVAVS